MPCTLWSALQGWEGRVNARVHWHAMQGWEDRVNARVHCGGHLQLCPLSAGAAAASHRQRLWGAVGMK